MARAATTAVRNDADAFLPFLTAYDPSDLPGTSVDPLGFDRGYNFLADQILPGLTNVARQPRYFGLLCAGALLGPDSSGRAAADREARQSCILRLERLWALANVLAADGEPPLGVRGVRYAQAERNAVARDGRRSTGSRFPLLGRQVQYGVLGIYGNVAGGMKLVDRDSLTVSPEYGEALGAAFLDETGTPRTIRDAAGDPDGEVGVDALKGWGARAGIAVPATPGEARILLQALELNDTRRRMAQALARWRTKKDESELERLARIRERLATSDGDLVQAIAAIVAYEDCYRWALLGFERVLWLCGATGAVEAQDLARDEVLASVAAGLGGAAVELEACTAAATGPAFQEGLPRMHDVRAFIAAIPRTGGSAEAIARSVLARHADVQHGKFDRGRRKLPWVEAHGSRVSLTLARASELAGEPRSPQDVRPHEYRTASAYALLLAGNEVNS
jgi:hypothetical protein